MLRVMGLFCLRALLSLNTNLMLPVRQLLCQQQTKGGGGVQQPKKTQHLRVQTHVQSEAERKKEHANSEDMRV